MCLIMMKQPGVIIPEEKFMTAFENNPHGWGYSTPGENGYLLTQKSLDIGAEELYTYLHDELKDDKVMVHLRYNTAGETSIRNAHPFPILEKQTDGMDVRMCHNGTIFKYKTKSSWESDTRNFVRKYVRPLFKRLAKGYTPAEMFSDPFVEQLLKEPLPTSSVLTFLAGDGSELIIHPTGNGGKEEDGVYYSNMYSFNANYRSSSKSTNKTKQQGAVIYPEQSEWFFNQTNTPTNQSTTKPKPKKPVSKPLRFSETWGLTPEELYTMDDELIAWIVEEDPESAVFLINELLAECYKKDQTIKGISKKLADQASSGERKVG